MEPQVIFDPWLVVDTSDGEIILPADLYPEVTTGALVNRGAFEYKLRRDGIISARQRVYEAELRLGWGARLSMPGYLDCTDWTLFESQKEAEEYLSDTYEIDID